MAAFQKNRSGTWRAIVRRKGFSTSRSFRRKTDAQAWANEIEVGLYRGESPIAASVYRNATLGDLIDQHITDMCEVGKAPGRSKAYTLAAIKKAIGHQPADDMSREFIIEFAKRRHRAGAGPTTIGMDVSFVKTVLTHAAAVHGAAHSTEGLRLARKALIRLGLVAKSDERDRRPTQTEIDRICRYFEQNIRQIIPMARIVRFAIATAMRQEEICRITWHDFDEENTTIKIRERKDPRRKKTNDQVVPLVTLAGYDPILLMFEEAGRDGLSVGRVFPYNSGSVSAAFTRACQKLAIEDLHFHDLRHEATSRLFEAGLDIPRVARITGHRDWQQLQRYTHLMPARLSQSLRA